MKKLEEYVRSIPDFPEPGIIFRDITTILQDPDGLKLAVDGLLKTLEGVEYDVAVGPESLSLECRWPTPPTRALCRSARRESCPVRPFP